MQVNQVIKNILKVIEQESWHSVEVVIQFEVSFQMEKDRKRFHKNYNKHDE